MFNKYNNPDCDKFMKARNNIDATKGVLIESMDKLLERGEKMEIMINKGKVMVIIYKYNIDWFKFK